MISIIKKAPGPVLVYSGFKKYGIDIFSKVLEQNNISFVKWTGNESQVSRKNNLALFNSKTNIVGEKIKCMLITAAGSEGISLKNVRQVHIMKPHWNKNRDQQVIGRAMRICSHNDLTKNERSVSVYKYFTVSPDFKTTDILIKELAEQKYKIIAEFLQLIINSAFDCALTSTNKLCLYQI
jgi:SNF2 family DNA or RNA helicase